MDRFGICSERPVDTMKTRLSRIFATDEFADIHFKFEQGFVKRTLPAHKLLLAIRSNVFKAMFYGPMAENVNVVDIMDIEYECFRTMLRDVYTDDVIITEANSIDLLKVAHKYEFDGLLSKCQNYLYRGTNIDNSCSIYSWGRHLGLSSLTEKTLDFILENADDVFKTEGFLKLSNDNLHTFLSREDICAFEEEIITAAILWAKHHCNDNKEDTTGQTMRQALGPVIYTLRIPLLSLRKYTDILVKSTILSEDEELGLYKYFTMSNKNLEDLCGFDKSPRIRLSLFIKVNDILKKKKAENMDVLDFSHKDISRLQTKHVMHQPIKQGRHRESIPPTLEITKIQKLSLLSFDTFFINAVTIILSSWNFWKEADPDDIEISGSIPTRKITASAYNATQIDINHLVKKNEEIEICFMTTINRDDYKKNDSTGWREILIGSNKSVFIKLEGNFSIVNSIDISAFKME